MLVLAYLLSLSPEEAQSSTMCVYSSAEFQGTSLNKVLPSGPDLTKGLIGVLMRFRQDHIPVTVYIEPMFYCFLVDEQHRYYLRCLWYKYNYPDKDLIDYHMRVHVLEIALPWLR